MSATLIWHNSGLGTKSGTTIGACFADLRDLVLSKAADSDFLWQVAASNVGSTPYWVNLKRKDESAGRILVISYSNAPAGVQPVLFDETPSTNNVFVAWFPSGNVDTPSNLTAATGTVMGNDTGAVQASNFSAISTIYAASIQWFYFESQAGIMFGLQNPALTNCYGGGAGALVVDSADTAYDCTLGIGSTSFISFGSPSSTFNTLWQWSSTPISAGAAAQKGILVNYTGPSQSYFGAYIPSGAWASSAVSATDILTDVANNKAWFVPVPLLGQTKGEGMALKLRQIGYGPGTTGPFVAYNTTGPVVAARQFSAATAGGTGYPWFTNFKL